MTYISTRRIAFAAAAATVLGTVTATAPALATSPSYTVTCSSANVDAARGADTSFDLSCEDADANPVDSYAIVATTTKGVLDLDAATGHAVYHPGTGARGTDTFTFKGIVDGLGESAVTTGTITLTNQRPTCGTVAAQKVLHSRAVTVPITCTDADGDALAVVTGTTGASHGAVSITDNKVVYTPARSYVGTDSFTLRATDGALLSDDVTVGVTVTNARPSCTGASAKTLHGRAKVFVASCTDADSDALTRSVVAKAHHGVVSLQGDKVTYKPAAGFVGTDTFTVAAGDGVATSAPATFTVKVTNKVPTCKPARKLSVKAGKRVQVKLRCTDRDSDALKVVVVKAPRHGKLVHRGHKWFFVAAKRFHGKVAFKLAANDGAANSQPVRYVVSVKRAHKG